VAQRRAIVSNFVLGLGAQGIAWRPYRATTFSHEVVMQNVFLYFSSSFSSLRTQRQHGFYRRDGPSRRVNEGMTSQEVADRSRIQTDWDQRIRENCPESQGVRAHRAFLRGVIVSTTPLEHRASHAHPAPSEKKHNQQDTSLRQSLASAMAYQTTIRRVRTCGRREIKEGKENT